MTFQKIMKLLIETVKFGSERCGKNNPVLFAKNRAESQLCLAAFPMLLMISALDKREHELFSFLHYME